MNEFSKSFEEFVIKRCENIIENNCEHLIMEKVINDIEKQLRGSLNSEQLLKFEQYEDIVLGNQIKTYVLIYKEVLKDAVKIIF